ncbi:uroporphyrinogen-III synthase [Marinilabilia rubra]|uniref:Uroporphyrinogen-III synthase n=1 Tax=Marinilabilia rubra TaxID=2162893 RepID=A0A2U2BE47_9BACT|nr:uroporphyrinogen-III synthase [Marinilabilia rubra]PWE01342.1 uroporphyrinogen-III synthase [Marinilabilia rubra]
MRETTTIITTWPVKKNDRFSTILESEGMAVLPLPMIEVDFRLFTVPGYLEDYDWVVFTSKNGAKSFLEQTSFHPHNKIAVIGEGTAAPLEAYGIQPHFVGSGKTGQEFADQLTSHTGRGKRILLALGNMAPDTLYQALAPHNRVERVNVYDTRRPEEVDQQLLNRIVIDEYDFIAVSSPSAIKNLFEMVSERLKVPLRIVSIGETTSHAARELGLELVKTATEPSYEGLAKCVVDMVERGEGKRNRR